MAQASTTVSAPVTVEEFFALIPDGQKADLIDGVIYVASPDSLRSNTLESFLLRLLEEYNEHKGCGGRIVHSRFAFELSSHRAPEPDVAYIARERLHLFTETRMKGGPDIAVEIVARESRDRDYNVKKQMYRDAGVTEYWIFDPLGGRYEFHRLVNAQYQLVPLESGTIFRSLVLPGFWLDVNWLLSDPLPAASQCLKQILAT